MTKPMCVLFLALVGAGLAFADINIQAIGDGNGYDETGMRAFRSTGVTKGFDADGNDEYGSAGVFFFGVSDGTPANGQGWDGNTTEAGPSWVTGYAQGAEFNSVSEHTGYGPYDDPTLSGTDVADWSMNGIGVAIGGGVGAWAEVMTFSIDDSAPENFRVGIMSGTQTTSDGRWDPTGLRLSADGGAAVEVTGLELTDGSTPGWVFFDIDLNGAAGATFSIEGQNRLAGQGTAISGVTFDQVGVEEMLAGYDFDADAADPGAATVVGANLTAGSFTSPMDIAFVATVGDDSGLDATGEGFGDPATVGCVGIGVDDATTESFADAVAGDDYMTFTVTPDEGFLFQLSSISFKATKKAETSVDEYAVTDAAGNLIGSTAAITNVLGLTAGYDGVLVDLSGTGMELLTDATEFRIYAWGRGTANTSSTLAALDKVALYGRSIPGVAPVVDNSAGVSDLLHDGATLNGTLTSTGEAATQVWVCWGQTDGGEDPDAWEFTSELGTLETGAFSVVAGGLTEDAEYFYRCGAMNEYGTAWSGLQSFTPSVPRITVDPVQLVEGNSGSTQAVFTVRLSREYPLEVEFSYSTVDGSAGATDYEGRSGTLTFLPGETEKQIAIAVWGDGLDEGDESFFLSIESAGSALVDGGPVVCTILSDERADYLSPSEVVADASGRLLYVVESTAGRIGVVDLDYGVRIGSVVLPQNPSGVALSADGGTLYVTGGVADGAVYVVDTGTLEVARTIAVGHSPRAPVLVSGDRLYVCEQFANAVVEVDLTAGAVVERVALLREPFGAALSPDGSQLVVANLLPHQASTETGVAASVSVIDTATNVVDAHIPLPPGSHSLRDVAVSPDGAYAVVGHALGRYRVPATQIFRGWTNTSAMSLIDLDSLTLSNTVVVDDLDLGAANPWGIGFTDDGGTLCLAHSGTHELSAIDWSGLLAKLATASENVCDDLGYLAGLRRRLPLPGNGPRGITVVGAKVVAANYFSDSLAVAELTEGREYAAEEIQLGWELPQTVVRLGKQHFFDATLSAQQWQSCTSCHPGVRVDALNWDLLNDGFGNAKNTKSLVYAHATPPTTWTGVRPNAETSVISGILFSHFVNLPEEVNLAIDEFLKAEQPVPSPYLVNGGLSEAAVRGQAIFNARCTHCHSGPYFTDLQLHDVGTGTGNEEGTSFDTPGLNEVWRTGPYLYDGRAATVREVLDTFGHGNTTGLSDTDLDDLVEYVNSL